MFLLWAYRPGWLQLYHLASLVFYPYRITSDPSLVVAESQTFEQRTFPSWLGQQEICHKAKHWKILKALFLILEQGWAGFLSIAKVKFKGLGFLMGCSLNDWIGYDGYEDQRRVCHPSLCFALFLLWKIIPWAIRIQGPRKNTNLRTKRRCRDVFFLLSDLQNTIGNLQWRQGPHVSPRATAQLRTLWWISLLSQSKGWCWYSFGGVNPVKSNTFTFEIEACPACPNVFFNCTKLRHTHKHYKRAPLDKRDFTLASWK